MNGLVEFLRARLDEDEAMGRAALHPDAVRPGTWSADPYADDPERRHVSEDKQGNYWSVAHEVFAPIADHIARHDPQRVLADVAAKRAIVDAYERQEAVLRMQTLVEPMRDVATGMRDALLEAARHLAAVYTDHPAYRQRWAP